MTDQLHQVLPVFLSQQSEGRQQRPAEGVVVGVAIVWGLPSPYTHEALRTRPAHIVTDLYLHLSSSF